MGGGDTNKTAKEKEPKTPPTTATQEQSSAAAAGSNNPDWSGFQAYSPIPPHGFLASSPQAHPYMWGVQHIMPPYGTPAHPYVAMYPHGGVYAHPTIPPGSYPFSPFAMPANGIPEASGNAIGTVEADSGPSDAKEKLPIKRSKESLGSLNAITGKNTEHGKSRGASANGTQSKSADSGSEGTSEGSDANSQNDSQNKSGGGLDSLEGDVLQNEGSVNGPQNGQSMPTSIMNPSMSIMPMSAPGAPALPGPTTNLNIGMDYWGAPASTAISAMHGKVSSTPVSGGIVTAGSRDGVNSQAWIQDERELKRQRRKQSNRESARRSRLRKQAECDELAQRARALKEENDNLRAELDRLKSDYEKLLAENSFLKERLGEGQEDFKVGRSDQSPSNDTQQTG